MPRFVAVVVAGSALLLLILLSAQVGLCWYAFLAYRHPVRCGLEQVLIPYLQVVSGLLLALLAVKAWQRD